MLFKKELINNIVCSVYESSYSNCTCNQFSRFYLKKKVFKTFKDIVHIKRFKKNCFLDFVCNPVKYLKGLLFAMIYILRILFYILLNR